MPVPGVWACTPAAQTDHIRSGVSARFAVMPPRSGVSLAAPHDPTQPRQLHTPGRASSQDAMPARKPCAGRAGRAGPKRLERPAAASGAPETAFVNTDAPSPPGRHSAAAPSQPAIRRGLIRSDTAQSEMEQQGVCRQQLLERTPTLPRSWKPQSRSWELGLSGSRLRCCSGSLVCGLWCSTGSYTRTLDSTTPTL